MFLPPAKRANVRRTLYFHVGSALDIDGQTVPGSRLIEVNPLVELPLNNAGNDIVEVMVLQGAPINEPVVAQGPFVMNTQLEIQQAMNDFRRTQFCGWPWPNGEPVHQEGTGRFAR